MNRLGVTGLVVGILGLGAAGALGAAYATKGGGTQATSQGFVVEPASNIGPDAFTPSVATGNSSVCDRAALVQDLQGRPDAIREWARVMGIPQNRVAAYVESLQPMVLQSNTEVTNHGLHNGQAYARQSLLDSGTAVLVDNNFPGVTTTTSPSTTSTTPGTSPTPVTRCKCGNPLLPPYTLTPPPLTTPRPGTSTTTTTRPTTSTTGSTTTTTRPTTTSTTGSTTTTTTRPTGAM